MHEGRAGKAHRELAEKNRWALAACSETAFKDLVFDYWWCNTEILSGTVVVDQHRFVRHIQQRIGGQHMRRSLQTSQHR